MSNNCHTREPLELSSGDSIVFTRIFSLFRASLGWSLIYEVQGLGGAGFSFTSTANVDSHSISVSSTTTSLWPAGEALLVGYAVNPTLIAGGERTTIYRGALTIRPNFAAATDNPPPVQTFAQQMLAALEIQLLALAKLAMVETRSQDALFRFTQIETLRAEHGYWSQVRQQEIAKERAKAGLPTGNMILPRMNILFSGQPAGRNLYNGYYGG